MMASDADVITLDSDDEEDPSFPKPNLLAGSSNGGSVSISRVPNKPSPIRPNPISRPVPPQNRKLPKKPGVFPPFALFSQEHRDRLINDNPGLGFGEIGRRLGEMWHALTEESKEDFRKRARSISVKKMADYQQQLRNIPAHERQQAINQANAPTKKRRTHGFAIFSNEMRKTLPPTMGLGEVTKVIADRWRNASPGVRMSYETRAARINANQQRRYQEGLERMQQTRMMPGNRNINNTSRSGTGLRIASVSSLSSSTQQQPKHPIRPNLPSSITISRVEPEVSIVNDAPKMPPRPPPLMRAGRPPLRRGGLPGSFGARMPAMQPARSAQFRNMGNVMAPQMHGIGMKRPRPLLPKSGPAAMGQKVQRMSAGPSMQPSEQKMCRICGLWGAAIVRLRDRPELVSALSEITRLNIDPVKDQMDGYPGEICRRCCNALTSYTVFKKTFFDGQERLKSYVASHKVVTPNLPLPPELQNISTTTTTVTTDFPKVDIIHDPSSIVTESILPDLDLDMDYGENPPTVPQPMNIKQERISIITPTMIKDEKEPEAKKPRIELDEDPLMNGKAKDQNGDGPDSKVEGGDHESESRKDIESPVDDAEEAESRNDLDGDIAEKEPADQGEVDAPKDQSEEYDIAVDDIRHQSSDVDDIAVNDSADKDDEYDIAVGDFNGQGDVGDIAVSDAVNDSNIDDIAAAGPSEEKEDNHDDGDAMPSINDDKGANDQNSEAGHSDKAAAPGHEDDETNVSAKESNDSVKVRSDLAKESPDDVAESDPGDVVSDGVVVESEGESSNQGVSEAVLVSDPNESSNQSEMNDDNFVDGEEMYGQDLDGRVNGEAEENGVVPDDVDDDPLNNEVDELASEADNLYGNNVDEFESVDLIEAHDDANVPDNEASP